MGKSGIYCYKDLENNNEIVYIGKDSNIHYNNRHYDHISPSKYNQQQINRILQNNPHRYQYNVLKSWETSKYSNRLANALEIIYIKRYNPKFNFTKGGDGLTGHNHSEETKRKIGKANTGKRHSEETKRKISKNNKTGKGSANHFYGKKHTLETRKKMSDAKKRAKNKSGYYRVSKKRDTTCKQGFLWNYQYYDDNGKMKRIVSVDIHKLEEKVKSKGLEWLKYETEENND